MVHTWADCPVDRNLTVQATTHTHTHTHAHTHTGGAAEGKCGVADRGFGADY